MWAQEQRRAGRRVSFAPSVHLGARASRPHSFTFRRPSGPGPVDGTLPPGTLISLPRNQALSCCLGSWVPHGSSPASKERGFSLPPLCPPHEELGVLLSNGSVVLGPPWGFLHPEITARGQSQQPGPGRDPEPWRTKVRSLHCQASNLAQPEHWCRAARGHSHLEPRKGRSDGCSSCP